MMNIRAVTHWLILLSFGLFITGCSGTRTQLKLGETADGEVVEAEGLAAMTDDLIGVKRAALADAYKNAIEKVVGIFISARTRVDKAITIEQNILGQTDGYIKKHEIIKEGKEADGLYHTTIRALVSFKQIERDLSKLKVLNAPSVGNPRVAILLEEKIEGLNGDSSACADALAQGLIEKGFKVVDRSELAAIRVAEATQELISGDNKKALEPIVKKLKAEVVIAGHAKSSLLDSKGLGGLISYRGTLSAKALKAQTGELLATITSQGSGLDATNEAAGQKAMTTLGQSAAKDLSDKLINALSKKSSIAVIVRGLPNVNLLSDIKDTLLKTTGVSDIYVRSFFEGVAEMDVDMNSPSTTDLAKNIGKNKNLNAKVVGQTQDSLEIQIEP